MIISSHQDNKLIVNNDRVVVLARNNTGHVVSVPNQSPLIYSKASSAVVVNSTLNPAIFTKSGSSVIAAQAAQLLERPPSTPLLSDDIVRIDKINIAVMSQAIVSQIASQDFRSVVWHLDYVQGMKAKFMTVNATFNDNDLEPGFVVTSIIGDLFSVPFVVDKTGDFIRLKVTNPSVTKILQVSGLSILTVR